MPTAVDPSCWMSLYIPKPFLTPASSCYSPSAAFLSSPQEAIEMYGTSQGQGRERDRLSSPSLSDDNDDDDDDVSFRAKDYLLIERFVSPPAPAERIEREKRDTRTSEFVRVRTPHAIYTVYTTVCIFVCTVLSRKETFKRRRLASNYRVARERRVNGE